MASNLHEEKLSVVQKYKKLAANSQNCESLCQDKTCLQFLVYILQDDNEVVVSEAVETLISLCEKKENRKKLTEICGFLQSLDYLLKKRDLPTNLKNLTRKLHQLIFMEQIKDVSTSKQTKYPLKELASNLSNISTNKSKKSAPKSFFLEDINSKAKTLVFQIEDFLTQEHYRKCEEQLLRIKGVISITFNRAKQRCILRTKVDLKPEIIIEAIFKASVLNIYQVVKNEKGEEDFILCGNAEKENFPKLPEYLSEDDNFIEEGTVVVKNQSKENKESSWLGSACEFLVRSFYW